MKPENKKLIEFSTKIAQTIQLADALGMGIAIKSMNMSGLEIELDQSGTMPDGAENSIIKHWRDVGGKVNNGRWSI